MGQTGWSYSVMDDLVRYRVSRQLRPRMVENPLQKHGTRSSPKFATHPKKFATEYSEPLPLKIQEIPSF